MQIKDTQFGNRWYPCVQPLKLTSDFKESLSSVKDITSRFANAGQSLGYQLMLEFHNLPFNLFNQIYWYNSAATTIGFSSVQGPADGFQFNGVKTKGMYTGFMPVGEQLCSFMANSMDERVKVAIQLDNNYVKQPELFVEIFREKINEFISQGQPKLLAVAPRPYNKNDVEQLDLSKPYHDKKEPKIAKM